MQQAPGCDVVIIDDDALHARQIARIATTHHLAVSRLASEEGRFIQKTNAQLAVITSRRDTQLLRRLKDHCPHMPAIVLGNRDKDDHERANHVLACLRAGASDVLPGDLSHPEALARLEVHFSQCAKGRNEAQTEDHATCQYGLAGRSEAMTCIRAMIAKLAGRDTTVLVDGPTGAGKELIALAIHRESRRSDGPLVAVNCAAIPNDLLEGEFFGYEKGAFSGAVASYPGKLALADGGTLFLDEIGEMSMMGQIKLLRALEARQCYKLGGREPHDFDVRIVAATNRDLNAEVAAGRFRSDLYYRIAVARIAVPPLAARPEDIAPLAQHFLQEIAHDQKGQIPHLSAEAIETLEAYAWPGNARELRNTIEVALINNTHGEINVSDLALPEPHHEALQRLTILSTHRQTQTAHATRASLSRGAIVDALRHCGGNKSAAARQLGCSRMTLYRHLKSA